MLAQKNRPLMAGGKGTLYYSHSPMLSIRIVSRGGRLMRSLLEAIHWSLGVP